MTQVSAGNAFSSLYRYVPKSRDGRENFLTDCLGMALAEDAEFARDFLCLVVDDDRIGTVPLKEAHVSVKTQCGDYASAGCCLDLVLDVSAPGHRRRPRIVVECKLGAPAGVRQLDKYLDLPVWGVAAVAKKRIRRPKHEVGEKGARWLKPRVGEHFHWADVHAVAARPGRSPLTQSLVDLLPKMDLDLLHTEVGRFGWGGSPPEQAHRRDFFQNWSKTIPLLESLGWSDCGPAKQAQLNSRYRPRTPGRRIEKVLLDPLANRGATLRLRLDAFDERALDAVTQDLQRARLPHSAKVKPRPVRRQDGLAHVVDVEVPMYQVLPAEVSAERRAIALERFVRAVLKRAG